MKRKHILLAVLAVLAMSFLLGCGGQQTAAEVQSAEEGTLEFYANGEDFIRQGFTSKDGWNITFDQVLVNVSDITAYQTDPPYDPDRNEPVQDAKVTAELESSYVVDLAEGDENAEPIFVGETVAPAGQYNALSWQMAPAEEGEMAGYSLLMKGTAEKDGEMVPFSIGVESPYTNICGEFVGDERKGILQPGETADLEMTFHFDHIFGDAELPADDGLNIEAPGFAPFALAAEGGNINTDLSTLAEALPEEEYQMLIDILPTLGHTGEGHCYYGAS